MKTLLPNKTKNQAGTELVPGAVLKAVKHFKLQHDVTIKWANGIRRRGCYRFRQGEGHVITLSTYYGPEQLSKTLWHELTHAVQYERAFAKGMDHHEAYAAFHSEPGGRDYSTRPIEVQARKWADHYHAQLALAR